MLSVIYILVSVLVSIVAREARASEFPASVDASDVPRLMRATEHVRGLSEEALIAMVPRQSGLRFVGCPNCSAGRQESQLEWSPQRPDEVVCRYCEHRYPSDKYPMNKAVEVRNPRGEPVRFPYWEDVNGYRHFFEARRDDEVRMYLADRARDLARLYVATGDGAHARRAALLLDRFAQVFPGWCYHFDYPFQQKEFYDGDVQPADFRAGYRTSRWSWWAYSDVPVSLVEAYDWIRESGAFSDLSRAQGIDVADRIERDLFRSAAEQVLANPETLSNMSPTAWYSLVHLGRVIGEPRYVHEPVRRLTKLMETQFFYDGAWSEGTPDYASQTVGGLTRVLRVARGYSDPPGYVDPEDGTRFDDLQLEAVVPQLQHARLTLRKMYLPDGRGVPVHDTWPTSRRRAAEKTEPYLLPALGHACLGGGETDRQMQFHVTWSGGYGHSHADNLSLLLYAYERELLSDLGYTHTAYRSWTLATAAHNTVVIDGRSQALGRTAAPSDGRLLLWDVSDPTVQIVRADGSRGYEGRASLFQRTLVVIDTGDGRRIAVDHFAVRGGRTHDYFLHGDADHPSTAHIALQTSPLDSLLPEGFDWQPTQNEGEAHRALEPNYAYGFLRQLRRASVPPAAAVPIEFRDASQAGPGVRAWLLPEPRSELIVGMNPSIRPAREDDAKLDDFHRPFLLLRRAADEELSRFVSVIEPYDGAPLVRSVEKVLDHEATVALRIAAGERDYYVVFDAERPVQLPVGSTPATFEGTVGVLALRGDVVDHVYSIGRGGWQREDFQLASSGPQLGALRAVEGGTLVVQYQKQVLPSPGTVVRIVTADNWVYPYTVTTVRVDEDALRLEVAEGPALRFDDAAQQLALTAFPQRGHKGNVRVEWNVPASRRTVK